MLKDDLPVSLVSKYTGLSTAKIEKLKRKLRKRKSNNSGYRITGRRRDYECN